MPIPVLISKYSNVDDLVSALRDGVYQYYSEYPESGEIAVWKSLNSHFMNSFKDYPILAECPVISLERADYVVVDTENALVIEAKGWKKIEKISDTVVLADGVKHIDPCYQLSGYVSKFNYFHSSAMHMNYRGILYMYNNNDYRSSECAIAHDIDELKREIISIGKPGGELQVNEVINGKFSINEDLLQLIDENKENLLIDASRTLLGRGYGLTEEQAILIYDVLESVRSGEEVSFIVRGESGSGKTLAALQLMIEAVSSGYKAILAYRNNRLLNTMRQVLHIKKPKTDLSALIQYYSTGRNIGIGESGFPAGKFGNLDLIVYDEAQRMTESVIRITQGRSRVKVYFYDDTQTLIGDEEGTESNFRKYCAPYKEYRLSSVFRVPGAYLKFVRHLLWDGQVPDGFNYDIKVFDKITDMIGDLKTKREEGNKIALLCAFTESKGDRNDTNGIENRRIGYPLPSGLDIYRDTGLDIHWLMSETTEYPPYWRGELDPLSYCASVYGSQGFEANYTGLVWGRDLVWRGKWEINAGPITDSIGNSFSVKKLAKSNPEKAMDLLKNRYYILLTRAIKGTDVFFEDDETRRHVNDILGQLKAE